MQDSFFETRTDLSALQSSVDQLKQEIGKVIVGQEQMVELLLAGILSDGHVLIEGVPGVAKTLTAKLLSKCISVGFSRIQFTPDLMPSDVIGTSVFNPKETAFQFNKGPIFSNIILIDEINRAPAKTQSALFEVMEERQVTVDGHTYHLSSPFMVVATQNPIEQEGTYHLPEAQLDRFLLKILIDYPPVEAEREIVARWDAGFNSRHLEEIDIRPLADKDAIANCRAEVKAMKTEPGVQQYIVDIVHKTRTHSTILYGASPRASVALLLCSKALAAIRGRDFSTPDDVRDIALPVLRHRIALRAEAELDGATNDAVISDILKTVEVPR